MQSLTASINNVLQSLRGKGAEVSGKKDGNEKIQPSEILVWDKANVDREIENKRSRTWGIVEIVDSSESKKIRDPPKTFVLV